MEGSWQRQRVVLGRVVAFDERSGLGEIEGQGPRRQIGSGGTAGGQRVPFHCVSIADGSRTVEIGAEVAFLLRLGRDGREWAAGIVMVAGGALGA